MLNSAAVMAPIGFIVLMTPTLGQESPTTNTDTKTAPVTKAAEFIKSVTTSEMLQAATELRKASESLERFGNSLQEVSTVAAGAADATSQNLAAIGGEFDPLGLKTAFETIQQQNAVIQAQSRTIIELQAQEIARLKRESPTTKRTTRQSQRRKKSRRPKKSDSSES